MVDKEKRKSFRKLVRIRIIQSYFGNLQQGRFRLVGIPNLKRARPVELTKHKLLSAVSSPAQSSNQMAKHMCLECALSLLVDAICDS